METRVDRRRRLQWERENRQTTPGEETAQVNPGDAGGQHKHDWELCGYEFAEGDHTCQMPSGEWITPCWPRIASYSSGHKIFTYKCRSCGSMRVAATDSTGCNIVAAHETEPDPNYRGSK